MRMFWNGMEWNVPETIVWNRTEWNGKEQNRMEL